MNVLRYLALIFVSLIVAIVFLVLAVYTLLLPVIIPIISVVKRVDLETGTSVACMIYDTVGGWFDILESIDL